MDRALAQGDYRRIGDLRAARLLRLRGRRESALPGGDEGMDRRRYMEAAGSRQRGGAGGREGIVDSRREAYAVRYLEP